MKRAKTGNRSSQHNAVKTLLLRIWRRLPEWLQWRLSWKLAQKYLVGVMAVVFDERGRVLLFHHTYRVEHPWALPGGWLKAGEDPARAIEREVREESALEVRARQPIFVGGNEEVPRVDLVFACERVGGDFQPSAEVSAARFFDLAALPDVEPYQRGIIEQARKARCT